MPEQLIGGGLLHLLLELSQLFFKLHMFIFHGCHATTELFLHGQLLSLFLLQTLSSNQLITLLLHLLQMIGGIFDRVLQVTDPLLIVRCGHKVSQLHGLLLHSCDLLAQRSKLLVNLSHIGVKDPKRSFLLIDHMVTLFLSVEVGHVFMQPVQH